MVNDAELERGGRLLGVTSDDLGHRLREEPAQRVDRALTGGPCRLEFLGTHHPDPTDMPKAATKETGRAGGETNPSLPGIFWEPKTSGPPGIDRSGAGKPKRSLPARSSHLGDPNRAGGKDLIHANRRIWGGAAVP